MSDEYGQLTPRTLLNPRSSLMETKYNQSQHDLSTKNQEKCYHRQCWLFAVLLLMLTMCLVLILLFAWHLKDDHNSSSDSHSSFLTSVSVHSCGLFVFCHHCELTFHSHLLYSSSVHCESQPIGVFQVSILDALLSGYYDRVVSVADVKNYSRHGFGFLENLAGWCSFIVIVVLGCVVLGWVFVGRARIFCFTFKLLDQLQGNIVFLDGTPYCMGECPHNNQDLSQVNLTFARFTNALFTSFYDISQPYVY